MKKYIFLLMFILSGGILLSLATGNKISLPSEPVNYLAENNSVLNDVGIFGPDRICLVTGSVIEEFSGGGILGLDVYRWKITGPSGDVLLDLGEKASLQVLPFTFSQIGVHTIKLRIRRGADIVFEGAKKVEVIQGATILLKDNYVLCEGSDLVLNAIDPATPQLADYLFEWQDGSGNPLGVNSNSITITNIGTYRVRYYFVGAKGNPECENVLTTKVSSALEFSLSTSKGVACPGEFIQISPSIPLTGTWSYEKNGNGDIKPLNSGGNLNLNASSDLEGFGDYTIYFAVANPDIPGCIINKSIDVKHVPNAEYVLEATKPTSGCLASDGALSIRAITDLDQLYYVIDDFTNSPSVSLKAGEVYTFDNLSSGIYRFVGSLAGCPFRLAAVVPLNDIPPYLEFKIEDIFDESCTETGKDLGGFTVKFPNGPVDALYKLVNERGGIAGAGVIENKSEITIEVAGGIYFFEVYEEEECTLPRVEEIEILGLPQVNLPDVEDFSICGSYEFIPQSGDDVVFTLTYPDGSQEIKEKGEAFNINMAGEFTLLATHKSDPEICPREKEFTVSSISAVDFEVDFFNQDCVGNQTYKAVLKNKSPEEVIIRWLNENDEVVGTGLELFPTSFGTFKLDVQPANSFACPVPAKEFEVKVPVLEVEVNLSASPLCPIGPEAIIELEIEENSEEVDRIEWVYFDSDGNKTSLTNEKNKKTITASEVGIYEVSVWNRFNCELGRDLIMLEESTDLVSFEVDPVYTVCEFYRWIPETSEPLNFILTYPNGEKISKKSSETFNLNMTGTYTIRGEQEEGADFSCPNEKTFEVIVVSPIEFEPVLFQQTCEGEFIFKADINNTNPDDALFIWTDENGQVLGDEQFFTTSTPGNYNLEVQPKGSLPCDIEPKPFDFDAPILDLEVTLQAETLCPDADSATLTLETEIQDTDRIEWWFTDFDGNRSQLTNFTGRQEISAQNEGTYEVLVYNKNDCFLGKDLALVMRSMDDVRPVVKENYLICGQYNVGEEINPGSFSSYSWYLDEDLVSTNPTFKPAAPGEYVLVVNSFETCEYTATFTVEEDCELRVSLPTGIRPEDPERNFLIYTNHLVDELEVWVFNKWGTIIFHCANSNLISESSTCVWDGTLNGQKIPVGSYAVKVYYKNIQQNITKTFVESVLVID